MYFCSAASYILVCYFYFNKGDVMDVIKRLEIFEDEINGLLDLVEQKREERVDWAELNRKNLKKLYPKKNEMYEVVDIEKCGFGSFFLTHEMKEGETYYFKPTNVTCRIKEDLYPNWKKKEHRGMPTVNGVLYDSNLKNVDRVYEESCGGKPYKTESKRHIVITSLKEISKDNCPTKSSNFFTKVYLMIDKNTGYYKIGRSKNPIYREKTLQSEKPTIELLLWWDAMIKDERKLHNMFSEKRIRGEWFDLSGSDIEVIKNHFINNIQCH